MINCLSIAARCIPSTVSQDMAVQLRKLQELQDYLQSIGVEKTLVAAVDGSLSFFEFWGPWELGRIHKGGCEVRDLTSLKCAWAPFLQWTIIKD